MNRDPLEYAGCQFTIVIPADVLDYMQNENILPDTMREVIFKALPMLFNSYSDQSHCLRSHSNDLCILCQCRYTEKRPSL